MAEKERARAEAVAARQRLERELAEKERARAEAVAVRQRLERELAEKERARSEAERQIAQEREAWAVERRRLEGATSGSTIARREDGTRL